VIIIKIEGVSTKIKGCGLFSPYVFTILFEKTERKKDIQK